MSGAMAAPDPNAGGMPPDAGADDAGAQDQDSDSDVLVTIVKNGDGSYVVYAGDEPDDDQGDMSQDDTDAMGVAGGAPAPNGGAPAPEGQPAGSIGEALKIAMTILQEDQSSQGGAGSSEDQFQSGFAAPKSPTPATGPAQKF